MDYDFGGYICVFIRSTDKATFGDLYKTQQAFLITCPHIKLNPILSRLLSNLILQGRS